MIRKPVLLFVEWPDGDESRTPRVAYARNMRWYERLPYKIGRMLGLFGNKQIPASTVLSTSIGIDADRKTYAFLTGIEQGPEDAIRITMTPEEYAHLYDADKINL